MRRRQQAKLLYAAFAFAVVGIAFFGSYAGMRYAGYKPAGHSCGHFDYVCEAWLWLAHDAAGFFAALLCIITAFLAYYTYGLFTATADLAEDANQSATRQFELNRDTARRQLRAYVLIKSTELEDFAVGQVPVARITLRNWGATPAYHARHWGMAGFDQFPPTQPFPTRDDTALPSTPLAPGGEVTMRVSLRRTLDLETWSTLAAGTHAIFVAGELLYTDVFEEEQETAFVLFTGGPLGATNEMGWYSVGNRAT